MLSGIEIFKFFVSDHFNCKTGAFPQIIHFSVYRRKQLQSAFLRKRSTRLNVPRVHTAAFIES